MNKGRFDPSQFASLRAAQNIPAARRAYQANLLLLSREGLKQAREWELFVRLCEVHRLNVDPAAVKMLDPPWPDLSADIDGHTQYFELGEVVQEDLVKALAELENGPAISSRLPLTSVWSPLGLIIQKKQKKKYAPKAKPLWLLLYAERNAPEWALVESVVLERMVEIQTALDSSAFDKLLLFLTREDRVPFVLSGNIISTSRA